MRTLTVLTALFGLVVFGACGPSAGSDDDDDDDDGVDADPGPDSFAGPTTRLSGRVWFPNQAPGIANPGEEIPVFGAMVYLSNTQPAPIPQQVYCEPCVDAPANAKFSSHDGSFEINAVRGDYWLVIQKGQWRLEQQISIGDTPIDLPATMTMLPAAHDPNAGAWMPKMAIVLGTNDNIEDVLGKIGVGNYNASTWDFLDGGTEITVFNTSQSATYFSLDEMRKYHIMFFPCNTGMSSVAELNNETYRKNIRTYVNEGGKIYVTDWSGEVMDRPFPPQIQLGDSGTDSTGTYDPATLDGTVTVAGDSDGSSYTSDDAEAVDDDLNMWLGLQTGPTPSNPTPSLFTPDNFQVVGNWNWIASLNMVQTGEDEEGLPLYDNPKTYLIGSGSFSAPPGKLPLSVTFEPTGCGRVLFSTYQTANGQHAGIYPQERVLMYLIGEIGVCSDNVIVE
jgi:hypothetical protein